MKRAEFQNTLAATLQALPADSPAYGESVVGRVLSETARIFGQEVRQCIDAAIPAVADAFFDANAKAQDSMIQRLSDLTATTFKNADLFVLHVREGLLRIMEVCQCETEAWQRSSAAN